MALMLILSVLEIVLKASQTSKRSYVITKKTRMPAIASNGSFSPNLVWGEA